VKPLKETKSSSGAPEESINSNMLVLSFFGSCTESDQMSKTVDDSGDQPSEEDDKLECLKCQLWCECDGSGIVVYSASLREYCDCTYYNHTCGKDD